MTPTKILMLILFAFFIQHLDSKEFVESNFYIDMKIVLIAIACGLGYVSHVVMRFPKEAPGVAMCLGVYCVLMSIHYYIENYLEKGAFFIGKSHGMSKFKNW